MKTNTTEKKKTRITAEEAQRAYYRQYYAANKDRLKKYKKSWYEQHPGKRAEYSRRRWEKLAAEMERELEKSETAGA